MGKTATNVSTVIVLIFLITTIILNGATYDWDGDDMDTFPLRSLHVDRKGEITKAMLNYEDTDCRYIPNPCINYKENNKWVTDMLENPDVYPIEIRTGVQVKVDQCKTYIINIV